MARKLHSAHLKPAGRATLPLAQAIRAVGRAVETDQANSRPGLRGTRALAREQVGVGRFTKRRECDEFICDLGCVDVEPVAADVLGEAAIQNGSQSPLASAASCTSRTSHPAAAAAATAHDIFTARHLGQRHRDGLALNQPAYAALLEVREQLGPTEGIQPLQLLEGSAGERRGGGRDAAIDGRGG